MRLEETEGIDTVICVPKMITNPGTEEGLNKNTPNNHIDDEIVVSAKFSSFTKLDISENDETHNLNEPENIDDKTILTRKKGQGNGEFAINFSHEPDSDKKEHFVRASDDMKLAKYTDRSNTDSKDKRQRKCKQQKNHYRDSDDSGDYTTDVTDTSDNELDESSGEYVSGVEMATSEEDQITQIEDGNLKENVQTDIRDLAPGSSKTDIQQTEQTFAKITSAKKRVSSNARETDPRDPDEQVNDGAESFFSDGEHSSHDDNQSRNNESISESQEFGCFGDDEDYSVTSVEHWTELEVEEEVMNKIIIQKPGEEPILNLDIIGQIRRGELRTDSEASNGKNEFLHRTKPCNRKLVTKTNQSNMYKDIDDQDIACNNVNKKLNIQKRDSKNQEPMTAAGISTKENGIDETDDSSDNSGCDSENVSSENESSLQTDSDGNTDSDTTSVKLSRQDKVPVQTERKLDSGFSEKKHISPFSTYSYSNGSQNKNEFNRSETTAKGETDLKYDVKSFSSIRSSNSAEKVDCVKSANKKMNNASFICKNKVQSRDTEIKVPANSNRKKRQLQHIEKLKRIYRHKVDLSDSNKKRISMGTYKNALPNIHTDKHCPSYSIKKLIQYESQKVQNKKHDNVSIQSDKDYTKYNGIKNFNRPNVTQIQDNRKEKDVTLLKKRHPTGERFSKGNTVEIVYKDLNSNTSEPEKNIPFTRDQNQIKEKMDHVHSSLLSTHVQFSCKCNSQGKRSNSETHSVKNINSLHNEITEICNENTVITKMQPETTSTSTKLDCRLEKTIHEMTALHGSSLDTNDSDFGVDNSVNTCHSNDDSMHKASRNLPDHVRRALIVDMPIQKVPAQEENSKVRKFDTPIKIIAELYENVDAGMGNNKEDGDSNVLSVRGLRTKEVTEKQHARTVLDKEKNTSNSTEIAKVLQEKRSRLRSSKTYGNVYEMKLSESHVTVPSNVVFSPERIIRRPSPDKLRNVNCDISNEPRPLKDCKSVKSDCLLKQHSLQESETTSASIIKGILENVVNHVVTSKHTHDGVKERANRCTTLDDEGNNVLCCILQAPYNTVDPSSFTCEVVDPLDVPPITKRHELLVSHVIKFSTCNIGHIANEREMVAKIPIAHFFVEPWQEVVIREVDKTGHWVETGEDMEIVQIQDVDNVVYGVQIALRELTYVAVVTRPRTKTITLEHRDRIIESPSDSRIKLRVPGTSDPRHVSLQSIPITEKIIKEFESSRGPDISSYLMAASPLVILSLEGPNPESFSFAVPLTSVDYVKDYLKEIKEANKNQSEGKKKDAIRHDSALSGGMSESKKKDAEEDAEEVLNLPPRIRKRKTMAVQENSPPTSKQKQRDTNLKLQELESKVHKRAKERYLVQLSEGKDKSLQVKLLDDCNRIKSMEIDTDQDEVVKFSVYDTYARLFVVEVHDIINFREIQDSVRGLSNYILKHRVRIHVSQDMDNWYNVKFNATVDQPFRQRWPKGRSHTQKQENSDGIKFLEMNEGGAIGLTFRGNIEVNNQVQKVFSFHGYRGINTCFDLTVKDAFSQKSLPEYHGAVQLYVLKRPRLRTISKTRVHNISSDWDLFTEYHFMFPKYLKKTPIIINRAPISLRFQEPLTVDFVRHICKELIKDWDTFAIALGISNARIQAIKQHNRNQISERVLMDIIVCWMKQQPISRDKVIPILAALRMCRRLHLENELTERYKSFTEVRTKTSTGITPLSSRPRPPQELSDKHIHRASLAVCQSRSVTVRWRQLFGYLLRMETSDVTISEMTSEIEEKYKNDATKCYHALQYWKSISGAPSIWKIIDALRYCNCPVAARIITTWSVLSSVMLCLLNHTSYQKKLQEELDKIPSPLSLSDRHSSPLTEAVLYESQRLLTPSPSLGQHECSEDVNIIMYIELTYRL